MLAGCLLDVARSCKRDITLLYLADGESSVRAEVAGLVGLEGGFADLITARRLSTESEQRHEFDLQTLAYRVDPRLCRRRQLSRARVQLTEPSSIAHRVLCLHMTALA